MDTVLTLAVGDGELCVCVGDLTASAAGAVVNAANAQLAGGGGVDGALHRAAGPGLLEAGRAWVAANGPLPTGHAVVTPGFGLAASWVIHTVGPVWRGGGHDEDALLARAYRNCLLAARGLGAAWVDFPAVSCGVYGFPVARAAALAVAELAQGLRGGLVKRARMVIFSADAAETWARAAREHLAGPGRPGASG